MKYLIALLLMALLGCTNGPVKSVSFLRQSADAAARNAVAAGSKRQWEEAGEAWRDALAAYQSIDDWVGQGRSRLGLAAVLAQQNRQVEAVALLQIMVDASTFIPAQRAQAAYQIGLMESSGDWIARARAFCGQHCAIAAQLDNFEARLAARAGAWDHAGRLANRALKSGGAWAEEAHAHRILAEVALQQLDWLRARGEIDAAIRLDRELGEPFFLLDDYTLLLRIAQAMGDAALEREARLRRESICAGLGAQACLAVSGALR